MKYLITEYDKELLLQHQLYYKIRVSVVNNDDAVIDILTGIYTCGSLNIDSDSNIRRTANFTIKLDDFVDNIEAKISNWLGLYYVVELGIKDIRTDEYIYYPCGKYCITGASTEYNASTNSATFDLSDRMAELDGTKNGQDGGAPTITIPVEYEGKQQTIRGAVVNMITASTKVKKYIVDDIGEFYGMPQNNPDYEEYRKIHDTWNIIPYDLEFSCGDNIGDMLFEIRDLYPNCQMYFDVYDNFCFDLIPSLDKDLPDMDMNYIEQILLGENSESTTYNVTAIKNVVEVFGKDYDVDYFSEKVTSKNNVYSAEIKEYGDSYQTYDMIALKPDTTCADAPKLQIVAINTVAKDDKTETQTVTLDALPIYEEYTETPIKANELQKDDMCVFRIYKVDKKYCAYYIGKYQPHAISVLTNSEDDPIYTKKYFSDKYNVEEKNVVFRVQPFSPFTVQKYGEVLDCKSGDEYDNILSDSIAQQTATYLNRNSSTMYDTVTINTVLIPWLDVNVKVNYRKLQENITYSYIVKSISHNFDSGSSEITMYRFMQLYEN